MKFWKRRNWKDEYARQLYAERWATVRCAEAGIEEMLQRQVKRGVIS